MVSNSPHSKKSSIKNPDQQKLFPYIQRYEAMDVGVKNDFTAIIYGHYDHRPHLSDPTLPHGHPGILYIEGEQKVKGPDMTTEVVAAMIRAKEVELWGDGGGVPPYVYRRVADNNSPLLLNDLGHLHQIHFRPTSKDNLHAMINELRVFIKAGRLRVSPDCPDLINCLLYAIWDKHRRKFAHARDLGHFDHLAALMYLVRNLDQHSDNIPKHWAIPPSEDYLIIDHEKGKSRVATALESAFKKLF